MKIAFKNSFSEQSNNFDNLPNLKKLKGYTLLQDTNRELPHWA